MATQRFSSFHLQLQFALQSQILFFLLALFFFEPCHFLRVLAFRHRQRLFQFRHLLQASHKNRMSRVRR